MNDKLLKEKLAAYSAPFDENAWAQMEAKLDNNKKRRGAFWWWASSTFMTALVATAGLLLLVPEHKNLSDEQWAIGNEVRSSGQTTASNKADESSAQWAINSSRSDKNTGNDVVNSHESSTINYTDDEADNAAIKATTTAQQNGNSMMQHTVGSRTKLLASKPSYNTPTNESAYKRNNHSTNNNKTAFKYGGVHGKSTNSDNTKDAPKDITNTNSAAVANTQNEVTENVLFASLNTLPASLLLGNNQERELQGDKKDDGSTKLPVKKKLISHDVGVIGGAYASLTQKQVHNKPSWFVGLQHSLYIGKYVAITKGIGFSQTTFAVNNVKNVDTFFNVQSYTTSMQSIAIPVGVNIYPLSNKRVSWYIGAGIVNHIKINEQFEFNVRNLNKSTVNLGTSTPLAPLDNNGFTEGITSENTNADIKDYQHGSKRYFANFYSSTGVEVQLWKGLRMNTGATYQLGISKTGKQDARPMYFGGEVGFKYKF